MKEKRKLILCESYFKEFLLGQKEKVQQKILWTLEIIQEMEHVPGKYFRHLKSGTALYEIRSEFEGNIFRVFCFFDAGNIIVVGHGFEKKTRKTPRRKIEKAEKIKRQYFYEKERNNAP